MSKREQLYEGMYIFKTELSDEARQKVLDKIIASIQEKKGTLHKMHDQGRRKLAYQIRNSREGHYVLLYFSIPTNAISSLWQEYHLNEDLIRFMTLKATSVKENLEFKKLG